MENHENAKTHPKFREYSRANSKATCPNSTSYMPGASEMFPLITAATVANRVSRTDMTTKIQQKTCKTL
jgi:hypothetical protein